MKSLSLHNSTKKGFIFFFTVTLRPFMKHHSPPLFTSRNIRKNAETNPAPMRDVIIEQPLTCHKHNLKKTIKTILKS